MSKRTKDPTARWSVRNTKLGTLLTINGEYHQSFYVNGGSNVRWKWYADMLRRAMRRLCPEREDRPKRKRKQT